MKTLATADPALECATFMAAPSALAFWARRQAHETAIHRADAESASGVVPDYAPDFAADGIDELIMGFGQRRKYRPETSADGGMQVLATDTGDAWHLDVDQEPHPGAPRPWPRPAAPLAARRPASTCSSGTAPATPRPT